MYGGCLNQLLDKFNEYKSIVNYCMEYIFEDDSVISFKLKQTDFPHLFGLHKILLKEAIIYAIRG